ncbi:MAG: hypothetical protein E6R04_11275 [Spirochaetes bacterium]|nr:MAG: hypothetical protein E6R04_11275 [Spirochaetota bacterium]
MNTEQEKFKLEEHIIYSYAKKNGEWEAVVGIAPSSRADPTPKENKETSRRSSTRNGAFPSH